jgi:hypothetical protein
MSYSLFSCLLHSRLVVALERAAFSLPRFAGAVAWVRRGQMNATIAQLRRMGSVEAVRSLAILGANRPSGLHVPAVVKSLPVSPRKPTVHAPKPSHQRTHSVSPKSDQKLKMPRLAHSFSDSEEITPQVSASLSSKSPRVLKQVTSAKSASAKLHTLLRTFSGETAFREFLQQYRAVALLDLYLLLERDFVQNCLSGSALSLKHATVQRISALLLNNEVDW